MHICGERLSDAGGFTAYCTAQWGTEHSHHDLTARGAVDAGVAGVTVTGYVRGHKAYYDGKAWRYADTRQLTAHEGGIERPCPKCGAMPTPEGYDACMGYIEGATSVCCGHGVEQGYIVRDGNAS